VSYYGWRFCWKNLDKILLVMLRWLLLARLGSWFFTPWLLVIPTCEGKDRFLWVCGSWYFGFKVFGLWVCLGFISVALSAFCGLLFKVWVCGFLVVEGFFVFVGCFVFRFLAGWFICILPVYLEEPYAFNKTSLLLIKKKIILQQ